MNKFYKYAVIILNYNVASDAVKAAESVLKSAKSDDFIICVADNGSENGKEILKGLDIPHVVVFTWDKNLGYAKGNNLAIRKLREECDFEYIVIMNPDVIIEQAGVIDRMISKLESEPGDVVGVQPLVHHWSRDGDDVHNQCFLRRCRSYWDEFLIQSSVLKHFFKKRIGYLSYAEKIPYAQSFYYEVPSGCFFMIRAKIFEQIGCFDERTFLYHEELILGHKIKAKKMKFVLLCDATVEHYHGKSTGNNDKYISSAGHSALIDSVEIYLRDYVGSGKLAVWAIKTMMRVEYALKSRLHYYGG